MWNFNLVNLLLKVLFGFFVILGAFVFCVGLILLVENVYVSGWDLLFQCAVPFIGAVFGVSCGWVFLQIRVWEYILVSLDK
tara:strand:- start:551 stop:793 length:243 start_codon:yes stop_codon:yes gene_type:complete